MNTSFFYIFRDFSILKMEAAFSRSGNAFFNKYFICLVETDFLSGGNSVFWSELFFCWWKPLSEIKGKQFSKKELIIANRQLILWLVENIFSLLFRHSCHWFFPSSGSNVLRKSFISASGNVVETDFWANNGFPKKKKSCK